MYTPPKFTAPDQQSTIEHIKKYSFATLVGYVDSIPVATHTPLFYVEEKQEQYLIGHIAGRNNQRHCFDGQQEMMAIFMEPHAYVSSSWYSHINAPTWNYISVHVYGSVLPMESHEAKKLISDMVDFFEGDREGRFLIDQMPSEQFDKMMSNIVAFKMKINSIESSFKLSQNRNDMDYKNIIEKLESSRKEMDHIIAGKMREIRNI